MPFRDSACRVPRAQEVCAAAVLFQPGTLALFNETWTRIRIGRIRSAAGTRRPTTDDQSERASNAGANGNAGRAAGDPAGSADRCAAYQSDPGAGCDVSATIRAGLQSCCLRFVLTSRHIQLCRFPSLKLKLGIRPQHRRRSRTASPAQPGWQSGVFPCQTHLTHLFFLEGVDVIPRSKVHRSARKHTEERSIPRAGWAGKLNCEESRLGKRDERIPEGAQRECDDALWARFRPVSPSGSLLRCSERTRACVLLPSVTSYLFLQAAIHEFVYLFACTNRTR